MKAFRHIVSLLLFPGALLCTVPAGGQGNPSRDAALRKSALLKAEGDSLKRIYDFDGALEAYARAVEAAGDTSGMPDVLSGIRKAGLQARNGLNMTNFCSSPSVVTRRRLSRDDFFLYYPLKDRSWLPVPNPFDTLGGSPAAGMYLPEGADAAWFSAQDSSGTYKLRFSRKDGGQWSLPQALPGKIASSGNDIFPMLSADGKRLYFASDGLWGMGGYDLYCSNWDDRSKEWGPPENLGIPYSSPADDFLFINSDDGHFSIFASNRDCHGDSVYVYILEYEPLAVRYPERDPSRIRQLAQLAPEGGEAESKDDDPLAGPAAGFAASLAIVNSIKGNLEALNADLEQARKALYTAEDEEEKGRLAAFITEKEGEIPALQDSLRRKVRNLTELELDCLAAGVDPAALKAENVPLAPAKRQAPGFSFVRRSFGSVSGIAIEQPEPAFDYSFRVASEGCFAPDDSLPDGRVFLIQIFTSSRKVGEKELKGLCPVFVRWDGANYIYGVGTFRSYEEAAAKLPAVRRLGFKKAFVTGYFNGKKI